MNAFMKLVRDSILGKQLLAEANSGGKGQIAAAQKELGRIASEAKAKCEEIDTQASDLATKHRGIEQQLASLTEERDRLQLELAQILPNRKASILRQATLDAMPIQEEIKRTEASLAELATTE